MERGKDRRTPDTGQERVIGVALTALEAAERLGVNERTIRRAIARGDLNASKQAGQFRISLEALDRYQSERVGTDDSRDGQPQDDDPPFRSILSAPKLLIVAPELRGRAALPRPLDALIGRSEEVAAVEDLLLKPDVRLLTLTGPGGVGKTRLTLAVAASLEDRFADGIAFVSLASISEPAMVLPTIARALGLRDDTDRPIAEGLVLALCHREMLLVIDNFEHVEEAAPDLAELLSSCPGTTILVTSRSPLRVSGEYRYPISPLAVPPRSISPSTDLADYAGAALFLDRAKRVRRGFALTAENTATVAAICARLDGLPLAIELAAAWLGALSPEALLERLDYRLPLLTGGNRDLPDRQRTMRDAVAWSYDLLTADEQRAFRQLAVFVGGFTLEAAENVVSPDECQSSVPSPNAHHQSPAVVHIVDALVAKNLLFPMQESTPGENAVPRFGMLETVREFALECLTACGEDGPTRARLAAWCLEIGEASWRRLWQHPLRLTELDAIEAEHANLRAALGWLLDAGDGPRALRLACSLTPLWYLRGHRQEGMAWLERAYALASTASIPIDLAARAAHGLGLLAAEAKASNDFQTESLRLARAAGDRYATAAALQSLVVLAIADGRNDEARTFGEESLAIFESLGMPERISDLRCSLGRAAYARGELDQAFDLLTASLNLARECADWFSIGQALTALALVNIDRGELAMASAHFSEAQSMWLEMGSKDGIANWLAGVATLATTNRSWEIAARLFGAVSAMQVIVGTESRIERVRHLKAERAVTDHDRAAFSRAYEAGRALRLEEVIAEASAYLTQADATATSPPPASERNSYGLTPRELEVLRLVAAGSSDREIADALFISRHTVMTHVSNILTKLDVSSRTAAAAMAVRDGLA